MNSNNKKIEILLKDDEETPTDEGKKVKVVEIPVFTNEDRKKLEQTLENMRRLEGLPAFIESDRKKLEYAIEKFDSLIEIMSDDRSLPILADVRDNIKTLTSALQENEERIVLLLARAVENMELTNKDIAKLRSDIDVSINYIRGLITEYSDRISNESAKFDAKLNALTENISEKFDAYTSNINNRLDNMTLQVVEPINDLSLRVENLKHAIDEEKIKSILHEEVENSVENAVKNKIKKISSDIRRIGDHLALLKSEKTLSGISDLRKLVKSYRVTKSANQEKNRILGVLKGLEDEIIDMSILNTVTKKMSIAQINESVKISDARLKIRLNALVSSGKLLKEKKGRYFVYAAKK